MSIHVAEQRATTSELFSGLESPVVNSTTFKGKLIVLTSFYDYRGHAPYIQSMVALAIVLERLGVRWDFWPVFGDFDIDRCLNEAYTRFMEDDDASDILSIDSDESFDPLGVLRLLAREEEIIGGAYRMKNNWREWTANWYIDAATGQPKAKTDTIDPVRKEALLAAHRLPWGFLRIKKSALEKYVAHFPDLHYRNHRGKKITIFAEKQYRTNGGTERTLFTQDSVLSERMREAGVQLWLDPNITIGHWGNAEFRGNLRDHLLGLHDTNAENARLASALQLDSKEAEAFAEVRRMAADIEERKAA
jgi:hypothetical protein